MFPTCAFASVLCAAASLPGENPKPLGKIGKPWSMTTPENCPCGRGHSGKCFLADEAENTQGRRHPEAKAPAYLREAGIPPRDGGDGRAPGYATAEP